MFEKKTQIIKKNVLVYFSKKKIGKKLKSLFSTICSSFNKYHFEKEKL